MTPAGQRVPPLPDADDAFAPIDPYNYAHLVTVTEVTWCRGLRVVVDPKGERQYLSNPVGREHSLVDVPCQVTGLPSSIPPDPQAHEYLGHANDGFNEAGLQIDAHSPVFATLVAAPPEQYFLLRARLRGKRGQGQRRVVAHLVVLDGTPLSPVEYATHTRRAFATARADFERWMREEAAQRQREDVNQATLYFNQQVTLHNDVVNRPPGQATVRKGGT